MKNIFLNQADSKEERKRRLKASCAASHHKRQLYKHLDESSMNSMMADPDLNEEEKDFLADRVNRKIKEIYTKKIEGNANLESITKLMEAALLTPNQKVSIINKIRKHYSHKMGSQDGIFDEALKSILISDDEKSDILFSLDQVRRGKFKLKNLAISDIKSLIEEAQEIIKD